MSALQSLVQIACLALLLTATQSLKLSESDTPSSEGPVVREHSVIKVLGRSPAAQDALQQRQSQIAPAQCQAVTETLRAGEETSLAGKLFQIACENHYECEMKLPDMSTGCLVASKDRHIEAMLATIGRPNPCAFTSLFINSFFGLNECPANRAKNSTSQGGSTYGACVRGSGFATQEEGCASMTKIGDSMSGVVDIYAIDAMIGLPETWDRSMSQYRLWHQAGKPARLPKREKASPEFVREDPALKIKFFSCPIAASDYATAPRTWKDSNVVSEDAIRGLASKQLQVLQEGFAGELTCKHKVYEPPFGDTGIRFEPFEDGDLTFIEDDRCNTCEYHYEDLWATHMPEERGILKVLLCKCMGLLGVSAFPWSSNRGTMFDYRTLPEGGMYKYDLGRTMVHEFGHYFGLYHTFQDGCYGNGDRMADTNKESQPFFGCPTKQFPPMSCGDAGPDPVHNLMDYADDRCMCAFTPDQRDQMNAVATDYIFPLAAS